MIDAKAFENKCLLYYDFEQVSFTDDYQADDLMLSFKRTFALGVLCIVVGVARVSADEPLPTGFDASVPFDEQVRWTKLDSGVRVFVNAKRELSSLPRRLVLFATPNGNTIEQSLGCQANDGVDWHFQIQHVAAQMRRLREIDSDHEWILAIVQAPTMSWPTFRKETPSAALIIHKLVQDLKSDCKAEDIVLCCHSGGGAFLWEYIASVDAIPAEICRIVFLDANYSYSDEVGHGDRLLNWLQQSKDRQLIVVAYDDREIELKGNKVVGPNDGTWRATERMLSRFQRDGSLREQEFGPFRHVLLQNEQAQFFVHRNPENKILHTALVGEMNGLLASLTLGSPLEKSWGSLGDPPAYSKWIQKKSFVERSQDQSFVPDDMAAKTLAAPTRKPTAISGSEFAKSVVGLPIAERESAILRELLLGNLPNASRVLTPVRLQHRDSLGTLHLGTVFAMSDYLSVGADGDSFRVPLSPNIAMQVAEAFGTMLLTTKLSDDVFAAATARLDPRPLTKDRESVTTFFEHHRIIEAQRLGFPDQRLVAGTKKDIVFSNALRKQKPDRVAIYGWHTNVGQPIQGLYLGHKDSYVDYSHGVRFVSEKVVVDGVEMQITEALKSLELHALFSNEGVLDLQELRAQCYRPQ